LLIKLSGWYILYGRGLVRGGKRTGVLFGWEKDVAKIVWVAKMTGGDLSWTENCLDTADRMSDLP